MRPSVRSTIACALRRRTREAQATVAISLSLKEVVIALGAVALISKTIFFMETSRLKTTFTNSTPALRGRTASNRLVVKSTITQRTVLRMTFTELQVVPKDQSDKDSQRITNTSSNKRVKGVNTKKMIPSKE